jgi:hypothetical protein
VTAKRYEKRNPIQTRAQQLVRMDKSKPTANIIVMRKYQYYQNQETKKVMLFSNVW